MGCVDEVTGSPWHGSTIGLQGVGGLGDLTVRASNRPSSGPDEVAGLFSVRELVPVDGSVRGDLRARPGVGSRGSRRGIEVRDDSGDVNHVLVVAGHELDVSIGPFSCGIGTPADDAGSTLVGGGRGEG